MIISQAAESVDNSAVHGNGQPEGFQRNFGLKCYFFDSFRIGDFHKISPLRS